MAFLVLVSIGTDTLYLYQFHNDLTLPLRKVYTNYNFTGDGKGANMIPTLKKGAKSDPGSHVAVATASNGNNKFVIAVESISKTE